MRAHIMNEKPSATSTPPNTDTRTRVGHGPSSQCVNPALRPAEGSRHVDRVGARIAEQAIQLFMKNMGRTTEKPRAQEDVPHLDAFGVN